MAGEYAQFKDTLDRFERLVRTQITPFINGDSGTTYTDDDGNERDSAAKSIESMRQTVRAFVDEGYAALERYAAPETRTIENDLVVTEDDQNVIFHCVSALTVTLPAGVPGGTWITVVQASGASVTLLAGDGATVGVAAPFVPTTRTRWSAMTAQRVGDENTWVVSGDCRDVAS